MTVYAINTTSMEAKAFETKAEAARQGNVYSILNSEEEFSRSPNFTISQMAEIYNKIDGVETPVKKFSDKVSGAKRIFKMLKGLSVEEVATPMPLPESEEKAKVPAGVRIPKNIRHDGHLYFVVDKSKIVYQESSKSYKTLLMIIEKPGIKKSELLAKGGRPVTIRWALRDGDAELVSKEEHEKRQNEAK